MKKLLLILLLTSSLYARDNAQGDCILGGKVITSGLTSTTRVLISYPRCTVTVSIHGGGLATLYSDNVGTPLANPFQATDISSGVGGGHWQFFADNGVYDVTLTGGVPVSMPAPATYTSIQLLDPTAAFTWHNQTIDTADGNVIKIAGRSLTSTTGTGGTVVMSGAPVLTGLTSYGTLSGGGITSTGSSNIGGVILDTGAITAAGTVTGNTFVAAISMVINGGTPLATTNQTGTGSIVLATSPTINTATLSSPTFTGTSTYPNTAHFNGANWTGSNAAPLIINGSSSGTTPSASANIQIVAGTSVSDVSGTVSITGGSPTFGSGGQVSIVGGAGIGAGSAGGGVVVDGGTGITTAGSVTLKNGGSTKLNTSTTGITVTGTTTTTALTSATAFINSAAAGALTINGGIANGSGFNRVRVTTGSVAANSEADVTVTWTTAFVDTNYTVNGCSIEAGTTVADGQYLHLGVRGTYTAKAVGSIKVRVYNDDGAIAYTGTLNCTAVHD